MRIHYHPRWAVLFVFVASTLYFGYSFPIPTTRSHEIPSAIAHSHHVHLPFVDMQKQVRLAVIGDYGTGSQEEHDVAVLVKSWHPDLVLTTGDNNYPAGEATTLDRNVGAYYHEFIAPYYGQYGPGGTTNRFFPTMGNHDWATGGQAHFDYFTLPGNERYYDVAAGPVHIFALDSDPHEPDGVTADSVQAQWLQQTLAGSTACWKLVYMHHPPFSSGAHGSSEWMRWPYQAWGADAVLAGHDHTYERIIQDGMLYVVNGLGGNAPYGFGPVVAGSQVRYNGDYGALLIDVISAQMTLSFVTRTGSVIDSYTMHKTCS